MQNGVHSVKHLRLTVLLALAFPAAAHAGEVAMTARDVPLAGTRTLASTSPPQRFNMLGVHWQGGGTVEFRTRRIHGAWSRWRDADADSMPDRGTAERAATGTWHDGNLQWTGGSDRVQFRTHGRVTRMRAYYVWSRVSSDPLRRVQLADAPAIVTRAGWKADEKIRRGRTIYAQAVRFALVHHTAGSNSYSPEQSAAIVRGIEIYHVKGNGWNDIGYNFLVDKYGQVFEGRYGGMERNVVGAHSEGFNTGSVGVALIGNNNSAPDHACAEAGAREAARLAARRRAHRSGRHRRGLLWRQPEVQGGKAGRASRDLGPPRHVSDRVPGQRGLRAAAVDRGEVAQTGLPKLYQPVVTGTLGGPLRFQARLSAAVAWSVNVTDAAGKAVAKGSGRGATVDWTWSSRRTGGPFRWSIDGTGLRSATGTLGGTLPTPTLRLRFRRRPCSRR